MSIVFLKVVSVKGGSLGVLQMTHQVWPSGDVSQGWEWNGANGTVDGGSWIWGKDNTTGKVHTELNSGIYNRIVANMFCKEWNNGPLPPHTPWFTTPDPYSYADDFPNTLNYYGPDGTQNQFAHWLLK